jgi:hypothetical protein
MTLIYFLETQDCVITLKKDEKKQCCGTGPEFCEAGAGTETRNPSPAPTYLSDMGGGLSIANFTSRSHTLYSNLYLIRIEIKYLQTTYKVQHLQQSTNVQGSLFKKKICWMKS